MNEETKFSPISDANTNWTFQKCAGGFAITFPYDYTRHFDSSITQSSRSSSPQWFSKCIWRCLSEITFGTAYADWNSIKGELKFDPPLNSSLSFINSNQRISNLIVPFQGRHTINSVPSSPKYSSSCTPGHAPVNGTTNKMTCSMGGLIDSTASNGGLDSVDSTNSNRNSIMSRSMEGPHSLPPQSPARPYSTNSTLDRRYGQEKKNNWKWVSLNEPIKHNSRNRFSRAFTQQSGVATNVDHKDLMRGEMMDVCNDCKGLVYEIIRSSKQTRSSARNKALRNLTLDLSPVYKRW